MTEAKKPGRPVEATIKFTLTLPKWAWDRLKALGHTREEDYSKPVAMARKAVLRYLYSVEDREVEKGSQRA
jgi:hypothetical protein